MNKYLEDAKKFLGKATSTVVEKSGEVYSTAKLSLKISKLKSEAEECYKKIGEIVYANYKGNEVSGDEAETLCAQIEKIYNEIDGISAKLAEIKGTAICPNCGSEVKKDSSYCAKCGTEM